MMLSCLLLWEKASSNAYLLSSPRSTSPRQMTVCSPASPTFSKPRPLPLNNLHVLATNNASNDGRRHLTLRDRLRKVTGFSFTAFRATLRGITGISLTALYASAVASTSSFVRNTMKIILSVFPTWVRLSDVVQQCAVLSSCAPSLPAHYTHLHLAIIA